MFQLTKDYRVIPNPEVLLLSPFKIIYDRDKTKDKDIATEEISYIWFFTDYKSDFRVILDDDERTTEIIKSLTKLPKNWKPDTKIQEAIDFYKKMNYSIKLQLLDNCTSGINKLSTYIRDINFDDYEQNEKTGEIKPKHDIKKFVDTMKQIPDVLEALDKTIEAVKSERDNGTEFRGGRKKGMYADEI